MILYLIFNSEFDLSKLYLLNLFLFSSLFQSFQLYNINIKFIIEYLFYLY